MGIKTFTFIRIVFSIILVYFVIQETGIATGIFCILMFFVAELSAVLFGKIGIDLKRLKEHILSQNKKIKPTLEDLPNIEFSEEHFMLNEAILAQKLEAGQMSVIPELLNSRCLSKNYDFGLLSMGDIIPFTTKMAEAANQGSIKRSEVPVIHYSETPDSNEEFPSHIDFDNNKSH